MPQKPTKSKVQGFTHGMVSDADPRFQIKGSYSDATNIRLTNNTGETFTVENINGTTKFIDLYELSHQSKLDAYDNNDSGILGTRTDIAGGSTPAPTDYFSEIYWDPNNTDASGNSVGPFYPSPVDNFATALGDGIFPFNDKNGASLEKKTSIVGYTSYGNEIILILVANYKHKLTSSSATIPNPQNEKERTIFLRIVFDVDMNIKKVEDLAVCYSYENDNYPVLGMKIDQPVRVESMVENECIARIYWTDNINPLRTLNLLQPGKNQLTPSSLDISPLMNPSQPVLDTNLNGSLPVGVYQYSYKYVSANGGETTFSPLSNLYHTSDQSFTSTTTYGGGPKGEIGTQGFRIKIHDIDQSFTYVELYALLYEDLNMPPRISLVDRKRLSGLNSVSIAHVAWNNEIENGLEEILIESNTWDICKDIAIKDNILFAANLRQKKNWISEKEWNVKVLRYNIEDGGIGASAAAFEDGMLTTNDPEIKHYEDDGSGNPRIPEDSGGSTQLCTGSLHNNKEHRPRWATFIDKQRDGTPSSLNGSIKKREEYRFLRDGITLGGESWDYEENGLGGCRVTFGLEEKVADVTTNDGNKPYVSSVNNGSEEFQTDNISGDDFGQNINNTNTTFHTTMSIAGNMDPHNAGNKRSYQRGEMYRFGVQIYDLNGAPGNVLWIGDIQMPEMYDVLRQLDPTKADYNPMAATVSAQSNISSLDEEEIFVTLDKVADHRLSYVWGHTVPPVDVNWFTNRIGDSSLRANAYVDSNGDLQDATFSAVGDKLNPVNFLGVAKQYPWWSGNNNSLSGSDDKHYLFDLYVNFEFIIPRNVLKKISGFRVVRAERTENDRRIIQQGILNQTLVYGKAQGDLADGYDTNHNWSSKDNENLDDDPIFTNDYVALGGTPSTPVQPEYDTYLNGYLGLAENNHLAWYDSSISTGTLTSGGSTEGKIYAFQENEDGRILPTTSVFPYRLSGTPNTPTSNINNSPSQHPGPGANGKRAAHSAFFGSYEKCQTGTYSTGGAKRNSMNSVSGSIFTLDSPDSAFGTRPYVFKEGDHLRIDSIMKLTDEKRYENEQSGTNPSNYYHNAFGFTELNGAANSWDTKSYNGVNWAKDTSLVEQDATRFSSKKVTETDKDYGLLIGKYYIYDTYWGIGMETDGGTTYAMDNGNAYHTQNDGAKPQEDYRYSGEIGVAKEIGNGEILPSGFFKSSWHMTSGTVHGFSNHTLGVLSDSSPWYAKWGTVRSVIGSNPDITMHDSSETSNKEDLNYNTMSSLQMGLRTIVVELLGISGYCFNPRNLSAILDNQSWLSKNILGTNITTKDEYWLGHAQAIGNSISGEGWKSYIPFKYLCSIVRKVIPYGGYSKSAIESTRYVPAGNFHPINYDLTINNPKEGHLSKVFGGDTFVNLYAHQKTSCPYMRNSYARWQLFPVESFINTDMRSGLNLHSGDTEIGESNITPPFSNDWLYNEVYSQENNLKSSIMINEQKACDALDLPFEIAYSNTKISGEEGDAFRTFPINQFHDMEGQYGEINRIINFKNDIFILQDEAFAKLLVNPISMITDDAGIGIFTGTGDTVENHTYISTKFGSRHLQSVVGSEESLYFVDSRYARLFKYDTEKLISLGDSLGQRSRLNFFIKELNDLDSFEKGSNWNSRNYIADNSLKNIGIQSIFDHKNKELLVTLHNYKKNNELVGTSATIVFNEGLNAFTSYYSAVPNLWMLADPAIISTGSEVPVSTFIKHGSGAFTPTQRIGALKLWLWDTNSSKCDFFNEGIDSYAVQPSNTAYIEKVINDAAENAKVFDNGEIIMTGDPAIVTLGSPLGAGSNIDCRTENNPYVGIINNATRYREGILRFPLRGSTQADRMRGTWLKMRFSYSGNDKFNIFAMIAKYRKSYN